MCNSVYGKHAVPLHKIAKPKNRGVYRSCEDCRRRENSTPARVAKRARKAEARARVKDDIGEVVTCVGGNSHEPHQVPWADVDNGKGGRFATCKAHRGTTKAEKDKVEEVVDLSDPSKLAHCKGCNGSGHGRAGHMVLLSSLLKPNGKALFKFCTDCRGNDNNMPSRVAKRRRKAEARAEISGTKDDTVKCIGGVGGNPHAVPWSSVDNGKGGRFRQCAEHRAQARNYKAHLAVALVAHKKPCVDCGNDRIRDLEFDHKPGEHKVDAVTNMQTVEQIADEIAKTECRCYKCHMRVTMLRKGRKHPPDAAEQAAQAFADSVLFGKYDGRCQFPGCDFQLTATSTAAERACMHWDHQPDGTASKKAHVSSLIGRGAVDALAEELAKCKPLCKSHHLCIVTRYRAAVDPAFVVDRDRALPKEWMEAAEATCSNPQPWIELFGRKKVLPNQK